MAVDPQKLRLTCPRVPLSLRTMKKILSLLLCYVFLQTETFALRGGPGGAGSKKFTGSYSGTLTQNGGSGLGLFLLSANSQGSANGSIVFFAQNTTTGPTGPGPIGFGSSSGGRYYAGTITGLVDPNSGTYYGLFSATATLTTTTGAIAVVSTISIAGTLKLNVSVGTGAGNTQIITGSAAAQTSSSTAAGNYTVSGWQTSSDAVSNGFGQVDTGG
jgi:hypothetical protein